MRVTQNTKSALLALLVVLCVSLGAVAGMGQAQAQDYGDGDGANLTETDVLAEGVSPGDNITVDLEFTTNATGTVALSFNQSQTLEFDSGENVSVTAGETLTERSVGATVEDLNGTNSTWKTTELPVEFASVNGSLTNPETFDVTVSLSGVTASEVSQSEVSSPSGGIFSSVGGENAKETVIILGAIVLALVVARNRDLI